MICPKCGSEIKENMLYCSVCGEEIKIVPDYDAAVDDTISLAITGVIDEIAIEETEKAPTKELISDTVEKIEIPHKAKSNSSDKNKQNKKQHISKRQIAILGAIIIAFAAIVSVTAFYVNRYYSFDYQYEKAFEEFENAEYEQSIKTIRHALTLDDSVPKIKLLLVDNYLELNKYDEALAVLYELLNQYPDDVNIYDKIAKIYEEKGDTISIAQLVESADSDSFRDSYADYKKPSLKFSVPSGEYDDIINLTIECDGGCTVYYTLDESPADNTKLLYTEAIVLEGGEHIVNAVCYNENGVMSDEISGKYTVEFARPDMPIVSVKSGEYNTPELIKVTYGSIEGAPLEDTADTSDKLAECRCYYTIDGDDPTVDDNLYDAPIAMYIGKHTYKFAAISDKGVSSEVYNLEVTLNIVNLVDMGTAKANLELWLNSYGLNTKGATYKCEQAYTSEGVNFYILNEYVDGEKSGSSYGVDVITGMIYKARRNIETGEYELEPVIKPL